MLLDTAIAPNTKNVYCNSLKKNTSYFINYFPGTNMVEASLEKNKMYISYLYQEGKSPNTIGTYVAALSHYSEM